jgi:uncharacterized protein (DUF2132 family)
MVKPRDIPASLAAGKAPFKSNDPLHGITLQQIVTNLEEWFGWEALAEKIRIHCFSHDPSLRSSLTFLRKTPWARKKVEELYVATLKKRARRK